MSTNIEEELMKQVEPSAIIFSIFTKEEILKLSVKKISTSLTFDALGHPLPDGLYDSALGPISDKSDPCSTCLKNVYNCPGHFGHFELPVVVVNPLFYKTLSTILKITCFACWQLQIPNAIKQILGLQMKLLDAGFIIEAQELANYMNILVEELEQNDEEATEILSKQSSSYPHLKKYIKLAKSGSIMYDKNKNLESIRNACIKNILKSIKPSKKCLFCKKPMKKITSVYHKIMIYDCDEEGKSSTKRESQTAKIASRMMMPDELKKIFREIWSYDQNILVNLIPLLKEIKAEYPTDTMFIEVILILPSNARPVNFVDDRMVEHPQTSIFRQIIETSMVIRTIIKVFKSDNKITDESQSVFNQARGTSALEKFHNAWQELQGHIDHLVNKNVPRTNDVKGEGIKQIIEKKAGIIRQHMMGKRVNFAARSVITPDPNLNINEIGVPEIFAKQLTYPVMVTTWNVQELRKMILNGPNKHPGAMMIENEKGIVKLIPDNPTVQKSIAKRLLVSDNKTGGHFSGVKIVHRHLLTGDILLLNRQPTLHKPSIMAHTARILKGEKTLRLHYANCKAYNADFDGDEMNAHFPQNELARSEAYNIVSVHNQYLVPKDGTPLSGLIQDHVISGVKLSIRGKFFTKEDYHQLVYSALAHKLGQLILLPPTIIKPICLWSGKQVLSTIIINTIGKGRPLPNLTSKAKIKANAWQSLKSRAWKGGGTPFKNDSVMSEAEVIIRRGELLCGVLDKMHYGATPYGLIHCIYELYGGQYSTNLLSAFAKLFTTFLQIEGFTLGVQDILVLSKKDNIRKKYIVESRLIGQKAAAEAVGLDENSNPEKIKKKIEESFAHNPKFRAILDRQYKTALDAYTNNINKTCIPGGLISKFPNNNLQLMVESGAKGSMVNCMQISCLLGQIELEGKRPPMMVSGRTLPSFPPYEIMPRAGGFIDGRFMTGIQPQEFFFHCMAGREGLIDTAVKTSRSGYLQRCIVKHLEGLTVAYDLTVRDSDNSVIQFFYGEDGMDICKVQFLNKNHVSFLNENKHIILNSQQKKLLESVELDEEIRKQIKAVKSWKKKFGSQTGKTFNRQALHKGEKILRSPDPVVSKYQPDHNLGVINENLESLIKNYLEERKELFKDKFSINDFKNMVKLKAAESLCAPGEPVGMLAAQSIGEPSTQMTLNTFHFAGRGEMNVTLGIPRLREILMFASSHIKTPNMDIPFKSTVTQDVARRLCKKLTQVRLADVLEKIHIKTHLNPVERTQNYIIKFYFLRPNFYENKFYIKPKYILKYMEKSFFENMFQTLKKNANVKISVVSVTEKKENKFKESKTGADETDKKVKDEESSSEEEPEMEESKFKRKKFDDSDSENGNESSEDENSFEQIKEESPEDSKQTNIHLSKVISSLRFVSNYKFDTKNHLWCELTFALPLIFKNVDITAVLKELANKSVIWETPNIRRAITYTNNNNLILRTDGINIKEMVKYYEILDLNKLYTNDIHAVAQMYGIEAAARVIINEIKEVFSVYGITVDSRHLSLIADYMTFDGIFQPLSRRGMEDSASPLQQMSFEASLVFLKNAVTQGKMDALKTPSSCLMVGYPYRGGTGAINLVHTVT